MKKSKVIMFISIILCVALICVGIMLCVQLREHIDSSNRASIAFVAPLMTFILSFFALLVAFYAFFAYTCYFPKNDVNEYLFNDRNDNLGEIVDNELTIKVEKIGRGIYRINFGERTMVFDLSGYFFPRAYIKAYFIRNYNFKQVRLNNAKLNRFFDGMKITYIKKYANVSLLFDKKKVCVIKNKKTKPSFLSILINYSPFWHIFVGHGADWRLETDLLKKDEFSEKLYNAKCLKRR